MKTGFPHRLFSLALSLVLVLVAAAAQAEARYDFASTPGKLPKSVVPLHYALTIEPAATHDRFTGRAEIEIEVRAPVEALVLNAAELSFQRVSLQRGEEPPQVLHVTQDRARELARLAPARGGVAPGRYRLAIDYAGRIGQNPQGFHTVPYKEAVKDGAGERLVDKTVLATHMEPVMARHLFPGWDEPAFRARFSLTAVIDDRLTAISNMPVVGTTAQGGGKKAVRFAASPPMSTYLVALFIGEFEAMEDSVDGIALRIWTTPGKLGQAGYAMQATKAIVHAYNDYFGLPYALPKLDQIALPGGFGGAMENWGAIDYNEATLLVDPVNRSAQQERDAFGIIAHEIAHQWFGDLVTMAWWDNLWLNEGFASWMSSKAAAMLHPEWQSWLRSALHRERAMASDARRSTHPIQTPVRNDARATDLFDEITYTKGEAFIRMLEAYLGETAFRDGIRRYMQAHRGSNATTADLWHHLSAASGRDVKALAASWTEQPGFPLVRAEQHCDADSARVTLTQERFTLGDPRAARLAWTVPVTLVDAAGARQTVLLDGRRPQTVALGACGALRVNAGSTGYYRTQVDDKTFSALAQALPTLPAEDQLVLLADSFALVQAGRSDLRRYLQLLDRLPAEADRALWEQAIEALDFLKEVVPAADRPAFDRYAREVLARPFARVGWEARANEASSEGLLRRSLVAALGRFDDPAVVAEALKRYAARHATPLPASLKASILDVVGRHADEAVYASLLADLRAATLVEERWDLQSALRRARDPRLALRTLQWLMTDELPPSEATYNLSHLGEASEQPELAWTFIREHLKAIFAKSTRYGRASILPAAARGFVEARRATELLALQRQWLDATALPPAEKAADLIRLKASVKASLAGTVSTWLAERARRGATSTAG